MAKILSLIACFGLLCVQGAWAEDEASLNQRIEVEKWVTTYYQHPSPDKVISKIDKLADIRELAQSDKKMSVMAFLTQIFQQNPQQIVPWMQQLQNLNTENKKLVMMAVWQSNTKQGKAYIEKVKQDKTDPLSLYANELTQNAPVDLLRQDIQTPVGLDMLWYSYFATGNPHYVEKIINMTYWANVTTQGEIDTQQMDKLMTVSVARWSLISNAIQQPAIYDIIKSYYPRATPEIKPVLTQILETILVQKTKNAQ